MRALKSSPAGGKMLALSCALPRAILSFLYEAYGAVKSSLLMAKPIAISPLSLCGIELLKFRVHGVRSTLSKWEPKTPVPARAFSLEAPAGISQRLRPKQ
jgi:hypothetical protein